MSRRLSFSDRCECFNDDQDLLSTCGPESKNGKHVIKYYFTPAELTPDMKKFLYGGLKLLSRKGIITDFGCEVFYLQKVEKVKQPKIAEITMSTLDRVKKAIREVRDQFIDNTEAVEYAFWGEKPSWMIEDQEEEDCIEADIFQDAISITEKLYGPSPETVAYRVMNDYWMAHVCAIGREKLEIDPVFQRLDQEYKTTQTSASQREWEKKCKEVEIGLMAAKHGYSPEEIKRRQDEEAFDSAVCENCKIFAKKDDVLFKLWGYMQIYWLKLPKAWHE